MLSKNQFFDWDRNCQPSKKDEHSSARNIFSLFVGRRRRRSRSNIIRQFLQSVIILLLLLFFSLSLRLTHPVRESFAQTQELATLACLIEERFLISCSFLEKSSSRFLFFFYYFSTHSLEFSFLLLLLVLSLLLISSNYQSVMTKLMQTTTWDERYSSNFLARENIRRHLSCEHEVVPSLILDNG